MCESNSEHECCYCQVLWTGRQPTLNLNLDMSTENIRHDEVAIRARILWEQAGQPQGRDLEFWLAAEAAVYGAEPKNTLTARPVTVCSGPTCEVARTPVATAKPARVRKNQTGPAIRKTPSRLR